MFLVKLRYFYTFPKVSKCFSTNADTSYPKQTWTIVRNLVEWGSPYTFASNPYFIRIWVWKVHSAAYLLDPREKKSIFQILRVGPPPPSVVFLNCCTMLFCNGLKVFNLKYRHHENVVSLFSYYKFNETSYLISFAKITI